MQSNPDCSLISISDSSDIYILVGSLRMINPFFLLYRTRYTVSRRGDFCICFFLLKFFTVQSVLSCNAIVYKVCKLFHDFDAIYPNSSSLGANGALLFDLFTF